MTPNHLCPKCHSQRVERIGQPAQDSETKRATNFVYSNTCLKCWYKWDGVADVGGVIPASIKPREIPFMRKFRAIEEP